MKTEGLKFFKGAKVPESKINEQMPKKKSQMKLRVDFQTMKYFVFSMVLKEKMSSI